MNEEEEKKLVTELMKKIKESIPENTDGSVVFNAMSNHLIGYCVFMKIDKKVAFKLFDEFWSFYENE